MSVFKYYMSQKTVKFELLIMQSQSESFVIHFPPQTILIIN